MSAPTSTARRERWIIAAALAAIAVAAWVYVVHEARSFTVSGVCECLSMPMGGGGNWSTGALVPLFFMWAGMMVAMMLPSAMPMILTFASVSRNRRRQERPYVPVTIFVAGYVATWTAFSVVAAVAAQGTVIGKSVSETVPAPAPPVLGVLFMSVMRSAASASSSPL